MEKTQDIHTGQIVFKTERSFRKYSFVNKARKTKEKLILVREDSLVETRIKQNHSRALIKIKQS